jgi:hypothetical protein
MLKARWLYGASLLLAACGGQSRSTPDVGPSGGSGAGVSGASTAAGNGPDAGDGGGKVAGAGGFGGGAGAGNAGAVGTVAFKPDHGCSSDAACGAGNHCLELTPGGIRYCTSAPTPLIPCDMPSAPNDCCSTSQCGAGECLITLSAPTGLCGNGGFSLSNKCRSDECSADQDCPKGRVCAPAVLGVSVRACVLADCRVDADCKGGGACVWVQGGCCPPTPSFGAERAATLACVYQDGCQKDTDCPGGICLVKDGRARCSTSCR